jgi:lysophospholipase L1-like esterase
MTITNAPPLTLTCPAGQSGVSLNNQPVTMSWPTPTSQGGTAPVQTVCTPASGSAFVPGVTPVSCAATDAAGEHAACAFAITITRPTQLSVTRFVAYGDSITWGTDTPPAPYAPYPDPPPSFAYPNQLMTSLQMRYPDQSLSMVNEGWPAEAIADGLNRLPDALGAANNPQALLLLEGANDLLGDPSSATTVYIASKLRDMVRAAKSRYPAIKVLLATFPPQTKGSPKDRGLGREFVPELNQRIAAVAQGEGVILVDLYAAFPSNNLGSYIGIDGLHPTQLGFTLMAQTFASVIQQTLEVRTASEGALIR